jgi:hypothetical protein
MGMEARTQWKAGDRRVNPTGMLLETRLRDCKQFLNKFLSSGGTAEFFIGWFVDRNASQR